ncbi:uncharacterized protein LOC107010750 [Solanum pennellii]|uniref:Uncharacterized protein LOC107010750 n=1 Tax=Solanum pennellii TaxID=28526 RepID=A0ABM1G3L5_SOLPN|nr:uncharacterized protein LOC107010750 [Solanum pennellii]
MASSMRSNGASIENQKSNGTKDGEMVVTCTNYKGNDKMPVRNDTRRSLTYPCPVPSYYADIPGIHLTVDLHIPRKDKAAAVASAEVARRAIRDDVAGEGSCVKGLIPLAESTSKKTHPSNHQP